MMMKFSQDSSVESDTVDSWVQGYVDWLNTTRVCPWINSHLNSTS